MESHPAAAIFPLLERSVPISAIKVDDRHRKDMGDIAQLAASIDAVGLMQPIGITPGFDLVFGQRRLRAFEKLGRPEIPTRFVNIEQITEGEFHENELRKDFTPSERVAILRSISRRPLGDQSRSQNFATAEKAAQDYYART